jgi:hypothetical protein
VCLRTDLGMSALRRRVAKSVAPVDVAKDTMDHI